MSADIDRLKDTILIIDDEAQVRKSFKMILEDDGFKVITASGGEEGLNVLKKGGSDLLKGDISAVLLDLKMPNMDGMETLKEIKAISQHIPVIMVTAHGDVDNAVAAIKAGAYDFVIKPPDFDKLIFTVERALRELILQKKVISLKNLVENTLEDILGSGQTIRPVINDIQNISNTNLSIIIEGETGTGKSYLARLIHKFSYRNDKPFIEMDIGSLTETLIESELFGHEKGSFTGAEIKKKGFFEAANGGTLFIDELQNMSLNVQRKFLGVIENKKFFPIGLNTPIDLNVRIITATNKNIEKAISSGSLREDLFYRLNEYVITIPPLRERKDDLVFFIEKFAAELSHELNKPIKHISKEAMDILLNNPWKGNFRELKNTIRRIIIFAKGSDIYFSEGEKLPYPPAIKYTINAEDVLSVMPLKNRDDNESTNLSSLKDYMNQHEIKLIINTLKQTNGNKTKAAERLKITYRGLIKKMNRFGILDY